MRGGNSLCSDKHRAVGYPVLKAQEMSLLITHKLAFVFWLSGARRSGTPCVNWNVPPPPPPSPGSRWIPQYAIVPCAGRYMAAYTVSPLNGPPGGTGKNQLIR
jgi:hypothetical protein